MEQFQYDPLALDSIRLVTLLPESTSSSIRCAIQHVPQSQTGDYFALSYCWGNPKPVANIIMNGRLMGVANNLHVWLQTILDPSVTLNEQWRKAFGNQSFWVDAICINQEDIAERNAQVQQMWRVYRSASYVLSWLGRPTTEVSEAYEYATMLEHMDGATTDVIALVICDGLDTSGYFDRVWIMPEVLCGSEVWLMSGSLLLNWRDVADYLDEGPRTSYSGPLPSGSRGLIALALQEEEARFRRRYDKLERVLIHLRAMTDRKCSDTRDRVFALLALPQMQDALGYIESSFTLVVDYNLSSVEVFIMTVGCAEQIDRTDQPKYTPDAVLHRNVIDVISQALGVKIVQAREWLRANASDGEIRLTCDTRFQAGPILLDLRGDGLLLQEEDSTHAYDQNLLNLYGPEKWRVPSGRWSTPGNPSLYQTRDNA
jgi:hypothetical protein